MTSAEVREKFAAPWGRTLKIFSAMGTGLLLGITVIVYGITGSTVLALVLMAVLPGLLLLGGLLFTIRSYSVGSGALEVQRLFWKTRIPLTELQSASIEPEAMQGSLRLCGNGGLFSFSGLFQSKRLGTYRAFVTDLNRCVVLRFPKQTIVVSPGSPERFVERLGQGARA